MKMGEQQIVPLSRWCAYYSATTNPLLPNLRARLSPHMATQLSPSPCNACCRCSCLDLPQPPVRHLPQYARPGPKCRCRANDIWCADR